MWATYFMKFDANSIIFHFPQRTIKHEFLENNLLMHNQSEILSIEVMFVLSQYVKYHIPE